MNELFLYGGIGLGVVVFLIIIIIVIRQIQKKGNKTTSENMNNNQKKRQSQNQAQNQAQQAQKQALKAQNQALKAQNQAKRAQEEKQNSLTYKSETETTNKNIKETWNKILKLRFINPQKGDTLPKPSVKQTTPTTTKSLPIGGDSLKVIKVRRKSKIKRRSINPNVPLQNTAQYTVEKAKQKGKENEQKNIEKNAQYIKFSQEYDIQSILDSLNNNITKMKIEYVDKFKDNITKGIGKINEYINNLGNLQMTKEIKKRMTSKNIDLNKIINKIETNTIDQKKLNTEISELNTDISKLNTFILELDKDKNEKEFEVGALEKIIENLETLYITNPTNNKKQTIIKRKAEKDKIKEHLVAQKMVRESKEGAKTNFKNKITEKENEITKNKVTILQYLDNLINNLLDNAIELSKTLDGNKDVNDKTKKIIILINNIIFDNIILYLDKLEKLFEGYYNKGFVNNTFIANEMNLENKTIRKNSIIIYLNKLIKILETNKSTLDQFFDKNNNNVTKSNLKKINFNELLDELNKLLIALKKKQNELNTL